MIPVKVIREKKETSLNVPFSWTDVSFENYLKLAKGEDIFMTLFGFKTEELEAKSADSLLSLMSFLNQTEQLNTGILPDKFNTINIGGSSWGQLEKSKQIINSNVKSETNKIGYENAMNTVVKIYFEETDISKMDCLTAIAIGGHIFESIGKFLKEYEELDEYEMEDEEKEAGADEEFKEFGYFNTLKKICNGNPLDYDAMLQVPAVLIYKTLLYNFREYKVQKRLQIIRERKLKAQR